MKIKESRFMFSDELRSLCIKYDWFTRGTNDEYSRFLNMTRKRNGEAAPMTANRLLDMALLIKRYSDPETTKILGLEGIAYCLSEICHSHFMIEQ